MTWDEAKLDALLRDIRESVVNGLAANEQEGVVEEDDNAYPAKVLGYWMYRLLDCKPGAEFPEIERRVPDGPLFPKEAL